MRGSRSARMAASPVGGGRAAAAAKRDAELEQLNAWRTTMTMLKDRLAELEAEKTAWEAEKAEEVEKAVAAAVAAAGADSATEELLREAQTKVAVLEASGSEKERLITVLLDRLTDKETQLRTSQEQLGEARRRITCR